MVGQAMATRGIATGTVTRTGGGGFTIRTASGGLVRVSTSASTAVIKQVTGTVSTLQTGRYTVAVGTLAGDGTLTASTIQQNTVTGATAPVAPALPVRPSMPGIPNVRPLGGPSGSTPHDLLPSGLPRLSGGMFAGLGCDADAIANTAALRIGA